jgi:hypothetical protein
MTSPTFQGNYEDIRVISQKNRDDFKSEIQLNDDIIASVFLSRTSLRGCIDSNIPYPEENTRYEILKDMGNDKYTLNVCHSVGGSMGRSCSKILVHFENREYQANNKQIKVLSVSK